MQAKYYNSSTKGFKIMKSFQVVHHPLGGNMSITFSNRCPRRLKKYIKKYPFKYLQDKAKL